MSGLIQRIQSYSANILDHIYKYDSTDEDSVRKSRRIRFLVGVNLIISLILVLIYLIVVKDTRASENMTVYFIPLTSVLLTINAFSVKYTRNEKALFLITVIIGSLTILVRTLSTGGIHSPVMMWYIYFPLVSVLSYGRLIGSIITIISLFQVAFVAFHKQFGLSFESFEYGGHSFFLLFTINMLVMFSLSYFFFRERKRFEGAIRDSEKNLAKTKHFSDLGILSVGVAHEVNNPLAIMHTVAKNIEKMISLRKEIDPNLLENQISKVLSASERISKITHSLLFYNQIKSFDDTVVVELQDVESNLKETYKEEKRLIINIKDKSTIKGELSLIVMAIENVINNALEAAGDIGQVLLLGECHDEYCEIKIRNTGEKISDEAKAHMFTPFYTDKDCKESVGLGLPTSRIILEKFNAKIELNDDSHETEFLITLKRA